MTTALQPFKATDATETKVTDAFLTFLNSRDTELDSFFAGANQCYVLGDVLFILVRDPMAGVITQNVFRQGFSAIHQLFTRPGTFEFYMEVFRAIWGPNVEVVFTVPDPGKLLIDVIAQADISYDYAMAREIIANEYFYDEILDNEGDNIIFQGVQGIKTESEAEALLYELYPAGIWNGFTLVLTEPDPIIFGSYYLSEDGFNLMAEDGDTLTLEA